MRLKDFEKFSDLITDQFTYGGKKYAHSNEREATDVLFDKHGKNWLLGTVDKYTFRFKTCKREKDLLKIATYMFILWLKRGFHIDKKREIAIDTNIKTKQEQFPLFIDKVKSYHEIYKRHNQNILQLRREIGKPFDQKLKEELENSYVENDKELRTIISEQLEKFSKDEWVKINEYDLVEIFYLAYFLWERNFKNKAGQDTDTWVEKKKEK